MDENTIKKQYSPHKRTRIVTKYDAGIKPSIIAAEEGVPVNSIRGIAKRYRVQKSAKSMKRCGRPTTITERDKRVLLRIIANNPFIKNTDLLREAGLECSVSTLTRYLKKQGIMHTLALTRPKLSEIVAAKRLRFARRYINQDSRVWERWIFSDETTIARGDGARREWVFCKLKNKKDKKNVQPRNKPTRHSQMFWAGFACGRRTNLVALPGDPDSKRGGVTSRQILACLQENLPTIAEPGYFFIQDNAPTHTARIVKNWLREWSGEHGINLVDWPPYSPDLNPIENLWKLLKEQILKKDPALAEMPSNILSMERLIRASEEAWEEFKDELLEKLATSMVRRLQAVIDAEGWYTKY